MNIILGILLILFAFVGIYNLLDILKQRIKDLTFWVDLKITLSFIICFIMFIGGLFLIGL